MNRGLVKMATVLGVLTLGNTPARAITVDMVNVGNAGNLADPLTGSLYGAVAYDYQIGKYEVTIGQYTEFLNAVGATDTYGLYNMNMGTSPQVTGITRSGTSGNYTYAARGSANNPITYVSWFDAARFSNWMANGQPTGTQAAATTEDGGYTLNGAVSGVGFVRNAINPNTGAATTYFNVSEDEWYKAAYYSPGASADSYWLYPTQSDSAPGNTIGIGTNQANFRNGPADSIANYSTGGAPYLTDVGTFSASASFYGTYDQGGNVWEWNDAVIFGSYRGLRGSSWYEDVSSLQSSNRNFDSPEFEGFGGSLGIRVVSIPEPLEWQMLLMAVAVLIGWRYRRLFS